MKTIVVFSGAGLSKESGIPTFRDSGGLWHNHKVEDVASPEGWKRDKEKVLKFYEERTKNINDAEPNEAHRAIARLQEGYRVVNITQNIDDLLERAGSKEVIHLHGSIRHKKCEFHQNITGRFDPDYPCYYEEESGGCAALGELCPVCGGQVRPDVVWFGEAVDMKNFELLELAHHEDTVGIIGVGTSGNVQPAASILLMFNHCKEKHFIDPNPPGRLFSWKLWVGEASKEMPKLVDRLLNEK
jgi:NAD-dependent deacetylase